jgi:hypothetical protein
MGTTSSTLQPTSTAISGMPRPFVSPTITVPSASLQAAPSCTATMSVYTVALGCELEASYVIPGTTTVPYLVPCLGCDAVSVVANGLPCAPGEPGKASTVTWTSNLTVFVPECSPTPDLDEYNRPDPPQDITTTLSFSNAAKGNQFAPTSVEVYNWAQGFCNAELFLYPTYNPPLASTAQMDSAYSSSQASITSSICGTATQYAATVHVRSEVDCGGCQPLTSLDTYTVNYVYCPTSPVTSMPTVTSAATRVVSYACED